MFKSVTVFIYIGMTVYVFILIVCSHRRVLYKSVTASCIPYVNRVRTLINHLSQYIHYQCDN